MASHSYRLRCTCWCHLLAQVCDLWTWSAILQQPPNRLTGSKPRVVMSCSMECKQEDWRGLVCVPACVCVWERGVTFVLQRCLKNCLVVGEEQTACQLWHSCPRRNSTISNALWCLYEKNEPLLNISFFYNNVLFKQLNQNSIVTIPTCWISTCDTSCVENIAKYDRNMTHLLSSPAKAAWMWQCETPLWSNGV